MTDGPGAGLVLQAAGLAVASAVVLATAALVTTRSVRGALGVFLDLLLVAGLLRLSVATTWDAIAAAAALIAVRKLAVSGLTRGLSSTAPRRRVQRPT